MRKRINVQEAGGAQCSLCDTHARYQLFGLGSDRPKTQINRTWHDTSGNSHELQDLDHDLAASHKHFRPLTAFEFAKAADVATDTKSFTKRYGDNVFLDSTKIGIRISMPQGRYNADEQTMCRFLVFRSKDRQSHIPEKSHDHANPHYDLFLDGNGYEHGLNGSVDHADSENYKKEVSHFNKGAFEVSTLLPNKKKYVFIKDCNFSLGRDFGSLAFETHMRWDWNDQMLDIPHARADITACDDQDDKNYAWYFLLIAQNPVGGTATQTLTTEIFGTTVAKTMD
jgi:hypothetical protein